MSFFFSSQYSHIFHGIPCLYSGLAQNLGALRALATVGIQAGHMKLHLRNMIASAGASADEIEPVAAIVRESGDRITMATVESALQQVRGN